MINDYEENIFDDPRVILEKTLLLLGKKNSKIVYLSCDTSLGAGGKSFHQNFPERHLEFGIAEQSAMGQAAGLAISGKIPFIAAYMPFITYRCLEQIRDDICKTNLNVNILAWIPMLVF